MNIEKRRYPDLEEMSRDAAHFITQRARECSERQGSFSIVLSGGHTPRLLFENLASPPLSNAMPWSVTSVFWGDERCVSSESADSNYAMAESALLAKVPVPEENIYRMEAEIEPPEEAARVYEKRLREFFNVPQTPGSPSFPSFDVVLLGMGSDGHTASLFPGDPVVEEKDRWVVSVKGTTASPPVPRITLTLPVLNQAGCVLFLVSGASKREIVEQIWNDPVAASARYPSARVQSRERVIWFTDYADR